MLWREGYPRLIRSGIGVFWLNLATFWLSFGMGVMFLAFPFILKNMGASDGTVGLCFALYMAGYMSGCLFQRWAAHRIHPKRSSQAGVAAVIILISLMLMVVSFERDGGGSHTSLVLMGILFACCSVCFSFYWPVVMGWVSTGVEGAALNRRLGGFNISWSSAGILSPLAGGYLVEHSALGTLAAVIFCYAASLACLAHARYRLSEPGKSSPPQEPEDVRVDRLWALRWMAMIALFGTQMCWGTTRSQLGLYLKMDLGYSETTYGMLIMIMSLTNFLGLLATSRTRKWHYRLDIYMITLLVVITGLAFFAVTRRINVFYLAAALVGAGGGFFYSSHIFYRVSGGIRRSARMALHEMTTSGGFLAGALAGGYLADHFGRTTPFQFCLAMFVFGVIAQGLIWSAGRKKNKKQTKKMKLDEFFAAERAKNKAL